ncbi:MAG: hypothetical protein JSS66_05370 [Armatimonadetes bacterium]|nr:hypothetical protein [Armatimonadota bacterium]
MKVVCVVPAGRERFMRILFPHLLRQTGVDAFELWENTNNQSDIEFMRQFAAKHPGFTTQPIPFGGFDGSGSIRHFMRFCNDPDTLYVRVDDDVCWMAPDCVANLVKCRLEHEEPFLVYANIVNNNICSVLHQHIGAMTRNSASLKYASMCPDAMANPSVACEAHDCFRRHYESGDLSIYNFGKWIDWEHTRICVNMISWFGKDMPQDGRDFVNKNEELEMSVRIPTDTGRTTMVCGSALAVHYSYGTQLHGVPDEYLEWYASLTPVEELV